jgi:hypothetical protein
VCDIFLEILLKLVSFSHKAFKLRALCALPRCVLTLLSPVQKIILNAGRLRSKVKRWVRKD